MDVHVKNNRYQILQFKQITKQTITENNMKQVNRIIKKSDKYNIKPGRMEQYYKITKNIS